MSLATFNIDLAQTNRLLERIATALERVAGPEVTTEPHVIRLRDDPRGILNYGQREWQKEQIMQEIGPLGLPPRTEREILEAGLEALDQPEDWT